MKERDFAGIQTKLKTVQGQEPVPSSPRLSKRALVGIPFTEMLPGQRIPEAYRGTTYEQEGGPQPGLQQVTDEQWLLGDFDQL